MLLVGDAAPLAAALAAVLAPPNESDETAWGAFVTGAACALVHGSSAVLSLHIGRSAREFAHGAPGRAAERRAAAVRIGVRTPHGAGDARATLTCRLPNGDRLPPNGDQLVPNEAATRRNPAAWQALLDLLRPALAAALRERYARGALGQVERVMDATDIATAACTLDGRVVHESKALRRLCAIEPDGSPMRTEVGRAARLAARAAPGEPAAHALITHHATYELVGRRLTLQPDTEIALVTVRRALRDNARRAAELFQGRFGLSPREIEVAHLLLAGRRNVEIARELGISESTARHHTHRVMEKLGVRSRAAIASRVMIRADDPEAPGR
jgi:DNA-binding CsgD family transcriptional regulator